MPIRAENKMLYPANWKKEIVPAVRARSGDACEGSPADPECRIGNGWLGYRDDQGKFIKITMEHSLHRIRFGKKVIKIVLTVGHLDHNPENCSLENLKHWCQRCHLVYDKEHHAKNRIRNKHNDLPIADLFGGKND
jgi:hypothetical protein